MYGRKMTIVFAPYGPENPLWAAKGWGSVGRRKLLFRFCDAEGVHEFNLDHVLILDGWHDSVIQAFEEYKQRLSEWEKRREEFKKDLELRLRKLMREAEEEWERENPRPTFKMPELRRPWQEALI